MKLANALEIVNTLEKASFLKVINQIISDKPKNHKEIDKILKEVDGHLKTADNESVTHVLNLIEKEYADHVNEELTNTTSHLDILIDILVRDGNSLMKREWLLKLYDKEVRSIRSKLKSFQELIESDDDSTRVEFYRIYKKCLVTAYYNDLENNQDKKVTKDEQTILTTLASGLELSHEEVKLINYSVVPLKKLDIDEIIKYLTKSGVILYSKKNHQVFVPDEVVRILRTVRGKEIADKTFRRVLKQLKDSQINLLSRKHNINWKLSREEKIKEIINEGINFTNAILKGIHKEGTSKTDKRNFLNKLIEKKLKIDKHIKGVSLESKLENLITFLDEQEKESTLSISLHGYDKLLLDLYDSIKRFDKILKSEFEIQDTVEIDAKTLLEYNIKPKDVLYLLDDNQLKLFCEKKNISTRGNEVINVLAVYKDTQNLMLENYELISKRDLNGLKEKGIKINEGELGVKFEEITRIIFNKMGLNVDEDLRKQLNDTKNKADIIIRLKDNQVMIVECKSYKEKGFNKYSSVSRQVKAYKEIAEKRNHIVVKSFIIAPEFSDEFIKECSLDYDLNLSLICSSDLYKIYVSFIESELEEFPVNLFLRDVLINSERTIKALGK